MEVIKCFFLVIIWEFIILATILEMHLLTSQKQNLELTSKIDNRFLKNE